jgi:S-adenosylmethionine uptake transporter
MPQSTRLPDPAHARWLTGVSPVLIAAFGIGVLNLMDGTIKEAASRYPAVEVAFLRFVFGAAISLAVVVATRTGWPSREAIRANGLRSVLVAVTASLFFYALSVLPLIDAIGVSFTSPFFVVLFGALLLGERLDGRVWLALGLGVAGMLVILGGQLGQSTYSDAAWIGALAVVGSTMTYALSMVLLRARARKDPLLIIVLMQNLGPGLILALPAIWVWVPVSGPDMLLFAAMGGLGFVGHLALGLAFARAEASRLAPVEFTALVWGSMIGFFAFGEVPGWLTLAGTALIVMGTLLNSRHR